MPNSMRLLLSVLAGALLGAPAVLLIFTDLGPAGSEAGRVASAIGLFAGGGLLLGFLNPAGRAWLVAATVAWVPAVLGAVGLWYSLTQPASADLSLALTFLVGPLGLALAGGWAGARLRGETSSRGRATPR